jgi:2-polyprenyl-3-methyl-5-hydroxy-6-metoxy-1,4-benzoquinol methylase
MKYDGSNSPEYWNIYWSKSRSRYEKYCMIRAIETAKKIGAKSVLDIGCGNGKLLAQLPDLDRFGIDVSDVGIKRMWDRYGVNGLAMSAYDVDTLEKTFDLITMNHTLEHIQEDGLVLSKCKKVLKPGGTMFVAVPNNMSGPECSEEHMRAYNKQTLRELMVKVFGNCEISHLGNRLFGVSKNEDNQ